MSIPLRKVTATEAIVQSLKERIKNGEFGPGEQLPSEQILVQEYGVSRLTLREALARLSALGVLQVKHGKGAFVTNSISISAIDDILIPLFPYHDNDRMRDLVEARNLIESEIAARVAENRTREQLEYLKSLLAYDESILSDPELFAERDYEFHFALVKMSGNEFFIAIYQALSRQIRAFLIRYATSIKDRAAAVERHRPILKAIIDQDVELARKLAREHATICASFVSK
jgi:GntR family transcriptional regulator, transcriptional repressor for pyruvate dehydrogenase complex